MPTPLILLYAALYILAHAVASFSIGFAVGLVAAEIVKRIHSHLDV